LDVGVYLVETVEKKRQPYPTMDAVYFISPEQGTKSSSSVVCKDFSDKIPMYKSVHLFFTNGIVSYSILKFLISHIKIFAQKFNKVCSKCWQLVLPVQWLKAFKRSF
jgi:hypothetical protein